MGNFNKVFLLGNLTRDPELRYTPKGMAIAKLGMAINRSWRDESGASKEEVTFVDVDAFGRQAEVVSQYLKKGRPVFIEGRLKLDSWEDKQTNQKRSKLTVVLESFQFVDSGNRPGEDTAAPASAPMRQTPNAAPAMPTPPARPAEEMPPEDDDVPF